MTLETNLAELIANEIVYDKKLDKVKILIENQAIDWEKFKKVIAFHELTPSAYFSFKEYFDILPYNITNFLKNSYYYCMINSLRLRQEFFYIAQVLSKDKIPIVPIKGIALLIDIYQKSYIRWMNDIDLLVHKEDLLKVGKILKDLGYVRELFGRKLSYWRNKQCHIAYSKRSSGGGFLIDLHWILDFKRNNRNILPFLWERTMEVVVNDRKVILLSPEDTFFSLVLHKRRFGKVICLKDVLDVGLLLKKYYTDFDWDYIVERCKRDRMQSTVFFMLSWVKFILGPDLIPNDIWKNLNVSYWKKKFVIKFFKKYAFEKMDSEEKHKYLIAHFLLYDTFLEPVKYILKIPQEQFARFYGFNPYSGNAALFYRMRILYISFKITINWFKILKRKWSLH